MKKLITVLALVAGLSAFADRTANQEWVARQITNAVEYVEEGYQAGDILLSGQVGAEATARSGADTLMQGTVNQVAQDVTNLTAQVQSNLDAEVTARQNAVSVEATARSSADTSLGNRITQAENNATNLFTQATSAISAESTARSSADTTLGNRITQAENNATNLFTQATSAVTSEATARATADTSLGNRITQAENNSTNLFNSIPAWAKVLVPPYLTSYTETDPTVPAWAKVETPPYLVASDIAGKADSSSLSGYFPRNSSSISAPGIFTDWVISGLVGGVRIRFSSVSTDNMTTYGYDGITVRRSGSDTPFLYDTVSPNGVVRRSELSDLSAVVVGATNGVNVRLSSEITNRQAADALLQTSISDEATARQAADALLQTSISDEATARQAADALLQQDMTNKVNSAIANHDFVVSSWVYSTGAIAYSEHPTQVNLADGATISASGDWPEGKPVYLRVVPDGSYGTAPAFKYLGYGSWPTTPFQATVWYARGQYIVNVLFVE